MSVRRIATAVAATAAAVLVASVTVPGFAEATRPVQEVFVANSADEPVRATLEGSPSITIAPSSAPVPVEIKQLAEQEPLEPLQGQVLLKVPHGEREVSAELNVPRNEEWVIERIGTTARAWDRHKEELRVKVTRSWIADSEVVVPLPQWPEPETLGERVDLPPQSVDHMTKLIARPESTVTFHIELRGDKQGVESDIVYYTGTRRRIGAGG